MPALYFGKKYSDLKKKNTSNQDFEKLSDSMMHADKFIIPLLVIIVIMLYCIKWKNKIIRWNQAHVTNLRFTLSSCSFIISFACTRVGENEEMGFLCALGHAEDS